MMQRYRKINNMFEWCYNILFSSIPSAEDWGIIEWLCAETFELENFRGFSLLKSENIVEIGPRLNFATAWNTNALSILLSCGILKVTRIERSRRYVLPKPMSGAELYAYITEHCGYDRMTEMVYEKPLTTFETGIIPEAVYTIPLIEEGLDVLVKEFGIAMDAHDRQLYYDYFVVKCGRNPTIVEMKDLLNSNAEHSRHKFFYGLQVINSERMPETLMDIVKSTLKANPANSRLAFCDNSSVIAGGIIRTIIPGRPGHSSFKMVDGMKDILFTAETHNFPSGIAPFPGAETGTGGRIRDVQATGRGGEVIAGTVAYCVGNLRIPGYDLPWEDDSFIYPGSLASPLQILIQASNGASCYGNEFGEPVIQGFARSFGLRLPSGERREWLKPIMFTGGIGQIDASHLYKKEAAEGMLIIQIGGPAYRVGFSGGLASSMLQGENKEELDFNAVQRGDAEMEQKMNRVVRTCIEMGLQNPIISIHDQGAGGPANVLKELVEKAGGKVYLRKINAGDLTLSTLEIWVCEYQERNGLLIYPEQLEMFKEICEREKVPCEVLGEVTGDGMFTVIDERDNSTPVHLHLADVLGNMPQKTFTDTREPEVLNPLVLPEDFSVKGALERVLRLVSVGSKRFLTNKVDRSVTGLIAQQQCVGPLQLPLSDVAIIAQSHFPNYEGRYAGAAIAIGEKPISGLVNPAAQGRLSVAEMITNIMCARITGLSHIKCSGNWMSAPKLPGEGAKLYDAAVAMRDLMVKLGMAIDGGKDSLSMATKVPLPDGKIEIVKSPGQLVISGYVTMSDITKVVTPDIKHPGSTRLIYVDLAKGKRRLGGSALAHVYGQIGNECPDVEDIGLLKRAFNAVQMLIDREFIYAYHDISDGGLIVTLLEMAFAGNCGVYITSKISEELFAEEAGFVIECPWDIKEVREVFQKLEVPFDILGFTQKEKKIEIHEATSAMKGGVDFQEDMIKLRHIWEETSYQLECRQMNPRKADEERRNIEHWSGAKYQLSFKTTSAPDNWFYGQTKKPKVAIIREEGSNGDREMASAFFMAGFEPWDVTMTDLLSGRITLEQFRGVVFAGGFSYADVMDSAKGWAGTIMFNKNIFEQFEAFYKRADTFSLGVCNGCQLMALLGWAPFKGLDDKTRPRFIQNDSRRFESRWSLVKILKSPAIMLRGMEDSVLGVWVAHGEGQAHFPDMFYLDEVEDCNLAPIRYADDGGFVTEDYPFNPNGSIRGIAALCSEDGRHLEMMPHPERAFLKWQWPYRTPEIDALPASPWLKMFQNAREWCEKS